MIKQTGNYERTKQTLKPQTPKIVDEHSASLHVCGYSNSFSFCASPSPLMACQADYERIIEKSIQHFSSIESLFSAYRKPEFLTVLKLTYYIDMRWPWNLFRGCGTKQIRRSFIVTTSSNQNSNLYGMHGTLRCRIFEYNVAS